jgi:hypothetical protein
LTYLLWLVSVLAPSIALYLNARALSLSTYVQFCDKFSDQFRRLKNCATDDGWAYEFGELLNLTENACHIYRSWIVWGTTRSLLKDYLVDVINGINNQPSARRAVVAGMTGDRTYNEISRFAKTHQIPFLERK